MDRGQKDTQKILDKVEKRISEEYEKAIEGIEAELSDYLRRYEIKDKTWRKWVENGTRSEAEYLQWKKGQLAVGQRWSSQKQIIAEELYKVNEKAKEIYKDSAPEIFADNANYATYDIEKQAHVDTSFMLYNKDAVERLIKENPEVLPPVGKKVARDIAEGKAVRWNRQQLQSVMIQGILQGDSIPKLASRLANTVGDRNRKAAIRNARTMATMAQNAGRENAFKRAQSRGVELEQMWLATLDARTRNSHRWLDHEVRPVGEQFSNGLEYPGDPHGDASEIYNCRCSIRGVVKGLERRSGQYRDTSAMGGMSYDEWKKAKPVTNRITLPEEKARNIKQKYLSEYRREGNVFLGKNGAMDTSFDADKMVYFNENADYNIRFDSYSEEVNESIGKAARKVAELGSRDGIEYAALVDLNSGDIPHISTSGYKDSVNSYFPYLIDHPDEKFVMVHNHLTESLLSYPDIEEVIHWNNLDAVVSTSNNGITCGVQSNGIKSDEYVMAKYADEYRRVAKKTGSQVDAEYAVVKLYVRDYCNGDMIIHDGRESF